MKKTLFNNLIKKLKNKNIRWKITACSLVSVFVMIIAFSISVRIIFSTLNILGDSYSSNAKIDEFFKMIELTENNMENYVNYHTFESIDSYYKNRNDMEQFSLSLNPLPSTNQSQMEEYRVFQLTKSFIILCDDTINARRSNNQNELNIYYTKTLECYNQLINHLTKLNTLLLQTNASSYNQNQTKITWLSRITFFFFVTITLLICFVIYYSITTITSPLSKITETANRVSKRDFDVPLFNTDTTDEIGTICTAFDNMIISIREYIDTIWEKAITEAELREKEIEMQALYSEAQLKALQYQINPHFLFNTLNTGAQLAMMEDADKTSYFLEQVADFFRYNIRQDKQIATISDELGLIDNFVYIMKVRFGERLNFIKDVSKLKQNDFSVLIPTMTLQPIVENCIKHGLKNKIGTVLLKMYSEKQNIVISISDNGSGIEQKTINTIFNSIEKGNSFLNVEEMNHGDSSPGTQNAKNASEHTGIGLSNVFLRLKKYYHSNCLYKINSKTQEGTEFIIKIPKDQNV